MADNQVQSSTLGGIGTGAASGASVGTSISPGIGTAIGAIAGGILGGVTANKKARGDKEAREEEVARVQRREDTAIRRATADSLAAGVDPRIQNQAPPSAGSASVEPYQSVDYTNDMVAGMNSLSNSIQFRIAQRVEAEKAALNILNSGYDRYVQDKQKKANEVNDQVNNVLAGLKTEETKFGSQAGKRMEMFRNETNNTYEALTRLFTQDTKDSQNIALRDDLVDTFGKILKSDSSGWNFGGEADIDFLSIITKGNWNKLRDLGIWLNNLVGENRTPGSYSNHASMIPGLGLGPMDNYTSEGAVLPNNPNSGSSSPGSQQYEKRYNPKTKEFETVPVPPKKEAPDGGLPSRGGSEDRSSRKGLGLGAHVDYHTDESLTSSHGQDKHNRTVNGDYKDNWTSHTGYTFTKDDIYKISQCLSAVSTNAFEWLNSNEFKGPDAESYKRFMQQYDYLVKLREKYIEEVSLPFYKYVEERYQPTMNLVHLLKFGGLGR